VLEELGLPREIGVASGTETTDREVPVDAHAPHVVGHSASEWFDASYVFTHYPSDDIFAEFWTSLVRIALRESERPESRSWSHVKTHRSTWRMLADEIIE
jgi:hypothetical protein